MSMKIGNDQFKKRVDDGVNNAFMRFAVSGAQERLRSRRLDAAEELGNWKNGERLAKKFVSIRLKI